MLSDFEGLESHLESYQDMLRLRFEIQERLAIDITQYPAKHRP